MSLLDQSTSRFGLQGLPASPPQAPSAIASEQASAKLPGATVVGKFPWVIPKLLHTQLVVADLATQGFEVQPLDLYCHFASLRLGELDLVKEWPNPSGHATEFRQVSWQSPFREGRLEFVLEGLEETYVLDDRSAVCAFLNRHRIVKDLLIEAQVPLNTSFNHLTVKKLMLVEDEEGFVTLFCIILFPGGVEEARRALHTFDDSWWLIRSEKARGLLNFDFDLI